MQCEAHRPVLGQSWPSVPVRKHPVWVHTTSQQQRQRLPQAAVSGLEMLIIWGLHREGSHDGAVGYGRGRGTAHPVVCHRQPPWPQAAEPASDEESSMVAFHGERMLQHV